MNNKVEVFEFVRQVARMNRLGDMIDDGLGPDGTGEKYPYQPDGCSDSDAQALYSLIEKAREFVAAEQNEPARFAAYRKVAKEMYQVDGEVEVDDDAVVSEGDENGAYVEAWAWVNKEEVDAEA